MFISENLERGECCTGHEQCTLSSHALKCWPSPCTLITLVDHTRTLQSIHVVVATLVVQQLWLFCVYYWDGKQGRAWAYARFPCATHPSLPSVRGILLLVWTHQEIHFIGSPSTKELSSTEIGTVLKYEKIRQQKKLGRFGALCPKMLSLQLFQAILSWVVSGPESPGAPTLIINIATVLERGEWLYFIICSLIISQSLLWQILRKLWGHN